MIDVYILRGACYLLIGVVIGMLTGMFIERYFPSDKGESK